MAVRKVTRRRKLRTYWLVSYQELQDYPGLYLGDPLPPTLKTCYLRGVDDKLEWRRWLRFRRDPLAPWARRPRLIQFRQESLARLANRLTQWILSGKDTGRPLEATELVAAARKVLRGEDPQESVLLCALDVQVALGSTRRRRWNKFYRALKET